MFEGTRAIDWVRLGVEGLVVLLILYEVVVGELAVHIDTPSSIIHRFRKRGG
jgi:hypothetical protein